MWSLSINITGRIIWCIWSPVHASGETLPLADWWIMSPNMLKGIHHWAAGAQTQLKAKQSNRSLPQMSGWRIHLLIIFWAAWKHCQVQLHHVTVTTYAELHCRCHPYCLLLSFSGALQQESWLRGEGWDAPGMAHSFLLASPKVEFAQTFNKLLSPGKKWAHRPKYWSQLKSTGICHWSQ